MSLILDDREQEQDVRSLLVHQLRLLEKIALHSDPAGALPVRLMASGSQQVAVNEAGELLVSDGPYDLAQFHELDTINTAYNFYGPRGREQFVITGFLIHGDKDVSVDGGTLVIYESDQPDSTTEDRVLVKVQVAKNQSIPFPNIRILCNKGVYINGKTDDDDVHMTIFGHYVDLQGRGATN